MRELLLHFEVDLHKLVFAYRRNLYTITDLFCQLRVRKLRVCKVCTAGKKRSGIQPKKAKISEEKMATLKCLFQAAASYTKYRTELASCKNNGEYCEEQQLLYRLTDV